MLTRRKKLGVAVLLVATGAAPVAQQSCESDTPPAATTTTAVAVPPATSVPPTLPPSAVPSIVPGVVTVTPSGGDDTAALVAAVRSSPTVVVQGRLRVDQVAALTVSDRTITFTPGSALVRTVRPATVTWQVLAFTNSHRVVLNNVTVVGPNIEVCDYDQTIPANGPLNPEHKVHIDVGYQAAFESQHGVAFYGSTDVTVNGGSIFGMPGDGIYFQDANDGATNSNITVNDATVECTGRSSISNTGSSNVTVNGGTFKRAGLWVINIEPFTSHRVDHYHLNHITVGYSNSYWLFAGGPDFSCKVTDVTVNASLVGASRFPPSVKSCVASEVHVK